MESKERLGNQEEPRGMTKLLDLVVGAIARGI